MNVFFRYALVATLGLGLAPTVPLPGQEPSVEEMQAMFPEQFRRLELSWEHYLQPPLAEAEHFVAFNLHLIGAVQPEEGQLRLYRQRMSAGGLRDDAEPLEREGLPEDFRLEAMTANAYTQSLVLAGRTAGGPVVFGAALDPQGVATEGWAPLNALPEGVEGRFSKAHSHDGSLFLFARVPAEGEYAQLAGYTINLGLPENMRAWTTMPPPPAARRGESVVMLQNAVFILGGEETVEEGTAPGHLPMRTRYEAPDFAPWDRPFRPVDLRLRDTVGFGYGSAVFLAPRVPAAPEPVDDEEAPPPPSMMEFQYAPDMGGGNLGHWRSILVEHAPAEIRAMTVDPGHSRLLLFTETETTDSETAVLHLAAYSLPTWIPGRRPSDEESLRAHEARHAREPARLPVDALLESIQDYESHGLIILPGDDEDTSLDIRLRMGSTRHRYMTMGSVTTFLEGAQGEEARQRFGVASTPAYVLLDKNGQVVGRHEGSIPSNEELFRLTSPIRSGGME